MDGPGTQKRNKGPKHKTAVTSEKDQDIQEDLSAADHKANSQVYYWAAEDE
jgi:hypothetical protein